MSSGRTQLRDGNGYMEDRRSSISFDKGRLRDCPGPLHLISRKGLELRFFRKVFDTLHSCRGCRDLKYTINRIFTDER